MVVVQAWYAAHPEERRLELEHWNTMAAERAERRAERHDERQERRAKKETAERELTRGRVWWPTGHEMWRALEEDVSDTDFDYSESEWDF